MSVWNICQPSSLLFYAVLTVQCPAIWSRWLFRIHCLFCTAPVTHSCLRDSELFAILFWIIQLFSFLIKPFKNKTPKKQLKCLRAVHPQPGDRHNGYYTVAVQHPSSLHNLAINWGCLCSLPSLHLFSWEMTIPSSPSCSTLLERHANDCRLSFPITLL